MNPSGHSFDAIAKYKATTDKLDKFLIYRAQNGHLSCGPSYVFRVVKYNFKWHLIWIRINPSSFYCVKYAIFWCQVINDVTLFWLMRHVCSVTRTNVTKFRCYCVNSLEVISDSDIWLGLGCDSSDWWTRCESIRRAIHWRQGMEWELKD